MTNDLKNQEPKTVGKAIIALIDYCAEADTIDHLETMFDVIDRLNLQDVTKEQLTNIVYFRITNHPAY